jgi:hypothetical protein
VHPFLVCFEINTAECSIVYTKYCSTVVNMYVFIFDYLVLLYQSNVYKHDLPPATEFVVVVVYKSK